MLSKDQYQIVLLLFHYRSTQRFLSVNKTQQALPSRAQVVVCGAGVVGSSVAYHLPKYGFKDIIHLEQGRLVTNWGEQSEPHTRELNERALIYILYVLPVPYLSSGLR